MEKYEPRITPLKEAAPDISNPAVQRELLLSQERKVLEAVGLLAARIKALPADPEQPDMEPRALLVGGFVRDSMLGKHPKDADVEVYGVTVERLETVLHQYFPGKIDRVGRDFTVLKVFVADGLDFDVSIPRRESKTGPDHTDFKIVGDPRMDMREAARRRDFTWNALAADPLTGEVFDFFNGIEDLKNGIMRVTDTERFQDDALRVYRAVQFHGRTGFRPEPNTLALMKTMVERGDLARLSHERVTEELGKLLLKSEKPSVGFELARELGIIEKYYPELHAMAGTPQEEEWHPEGDAWVHTMMAVDAAAKLIRQPERGFSKAEKIQVMIGALCHDLGKPATTKVLKGRVRSLAHEEAGRKPTKAMLGRLKFGEDVAQAAETIAAEHLKPAMLHMSRMKESHSESALDQKQYENAVRKLIKRIHPTSWRVLVAASESDSRGRAIPGVDRDPYEAGLMFAKTIVEKKLDVEPTKPLIGGVDIIAAAGELGMKIKPGPRFGELVRTVESARDEGQITTREEALAMLKRLLGESK